MNKQQMLRRVAVAVLGLACAMPALARDPFGLQIDVGNDGTVELGLGFSNINEAIDSLDFQRLSQRVSYDGSQPVGVDFYLRGLPVVLRFPNPNDGSLFFGIPGVPIKNGQDFVTFSPRSEFFTTIEARSDTIQQLKDFLKTNQVALKAILTALARFSPIDPLAGNPLSLMTQKMKGDFRNGFTHKVSQIWGCGTSAFNFTDDQPIMVAAVGGVGDIFADAQARAAALRAGNEIGAGVFLTSTEADGFASTGLTIPLSYTANLDDHPGHKLRVDLPLSYTDTEGAVTYSLGFGLAYTYPISEVWTLTPGVGVGATGSEDLGAAGGVGAYSLTSAYTWRLGNYAVSMGNSIGQYDSLGLKLGDVEAEADISNTVFTNGFLLTGPNSLIAKNLVLEYSFQDTRVTGDTVYSDYYDEVGIALGYIDTERGVINRYVKGGLSYLVGANDITAIKLNLSVRF